MDPQTLSDRGKLLYGFAVAHVQSYLLASPRLRDIQGGSQLLEDLCGRLFKHACEAAGVEDLRILSQAAGGARLETRDAEALTRLHAAWPLIAEAHAPGTLIQQALVDIDEAGGMAAAQRLLGERLQASRAAPACSLPAVGPLVARYARTGEPAEREQAVGGERERIDRATDAKVQVWRDLKEQATLDQRFLGPGLVDLYRFAAGRENEADSLSSEDDPYVAVVHADGNSVGRFIDDLLTAARDRDDSAAVFQRFSDALSRATREAANEAVREVLVHDFEATRKAAEERQRSATGSEELAVLKARPIVLGGDDLTIILTARLAFDFVERFLAAFERTTAEHLRTFGVPGFDCLTASAGLALTKEKFPFDRAYELAESLCHQAKRHAKAKASTAPSTLAFHRVTTSLPQDAATVLAQELTRGRHRLTFEAYRTGDRPAEKLADFAALRRLAAAIPDGQRGGFRGLLVELRRSPERAEEAFGRMCEIRRRRGAAAEIEKLVAALRELNGDERLLWREDPESTLLRTPLLDAHVVARTGRTAVTGGRT